MQPVHEEISGDVFDRQRVMVGFDQPLIEEQVVFVLGVGGLGQSVAMALCRLGIKKAFLLDRDVYDATNLTRQILGGLTDVGDRKVAGVCYDTSCCYSSWGVGNQLL